MNISTTMNPIIPPFSYDTFQVEDSIGYLLSRSKSMLSKSVDDALVEMEITHAQASVFMMLALGKCSTAAELARDLFIDAGAMKRMLDRMEAKGFIQRAPHPEDKRLYLIQLTQQGKALADQLPAIFCDVLTIGFTNFTPEEIGFLKSLLRKLLANRSLLEAHKPGHTK